MRPGPSARLALRLAALVLVAGCGSSPPETPPQSAAPPPGTGAPATDAGSQTVVEGAQDSAEVAPGSPNAAYRYRFNQIAPGSDRFTFQDRELSFYFRPAPDALYLQVENRQDRPVWIEWDRCTFFDPRGNTGKVAHATTKWVDRFNVQPPTQVMGLQRYSDFLLPIDYLVDPSGGSTTSHRPLLPEDQSAPQYADKEFGVDLVFRIEDRQVTYPFRFRVASVLPR